MLETLTEQPTDQIIALMQTFRDDPRPGKIDLGVGVYRNAQGQTPVMAAVKAAETRLLHEQDTKSYVGLAGDPAFHDALADLILGSAVPSGRIAAAATPGGTGALRQGLELVMSANPGTTIWLSSPTWPNHPSIITYLGMPVAEYRYFDPATGGLDFSGMLTDLSSAKPGDIVVLHGCCHNPTGANLNLAQWQEIADLLLVRKLIPFVDIAYQGFGDGLDADAFGTRHLAKRLPEVLIAASCSKTFGVYRDRVGILLAVSQEAARARVQDTLAALNRMNYSFPPDHGARLVTMVLTSPALRAQWEAELDEMRTGMLRMRTLLAEALRKRTRSDRFGFLAEHRGMFSLLGATPEQVKTLREDHGIYMIGDSRMNVAGLNEAVIDVVADAIVSVGV